MTKARLVPQDGLRDGYRPRYSPRPARFDVKREAKSEIGVSRPDRTSCGRTPERKSGLRDALVTDGTSVWWASGKHHPVRGLGRCETEQKAAGTWRETIVVE